MSRTGTGEVKSSAIYAEARSAGGRLIFVGDIHGCYDEMVELLDRIDPTGRDVVVSCGDIVRKGPEVTRCLDLWRARNYLAVLGNNEMKILRLAESAVKRLLWLPDRALLHRKDLLDYIRTWPLFIDFPREGVSAVHGGVLPGTEITEASIRKQRDVVHRLRYVRQVGGKWEMARKGDEKPDDALWSDVWNGNRTIAYGHTPLQEPRIDKKAIGLDTGCVYGGKLSAAIFDGRGWETVSVRAKRRYA
jgi:serine/threonine protein phosphatase 1